MTDRETLTVVVFDYDANTFRTETLPYTDTAAFLKLAYSVVDPEDSAVRLDVAHVTYDGLTAWVDDEGLLNDNQQRLSKVFDYPQPLAGSIVFTGPPDEEGYSKSVPERYFADDFALMKQSVRRIDQLGVGVYIYRDPVKV